MKHKGEVPHIFSKFKAEVENLLSTTIKIYAPMAAQNISQSKHNFLKLYIKPRVHTRLNKMA